MHIHDAAAALARMKQGLIVGAFTSTYPAGIGIFLILGLCCGSVLGWAVHGRMLVLMFECR